MVRRDLEPYGSRAVSPTNANRARGKWVISERSTVSPPKPESKTPTVGAPEEAGKNGVPLMAVTLVMRAPALRDTCGSDRRGLRAFHAAGHPPGNALR